MGRFAVAKGLGNGAEVGLVVFLLGVIVDWKFWSLGILAFFVGVYAA